MAVATFTKSGTKATTAVKLDAGVFGVEVKNHELLKAAYTAYLANGRQNLAKTLKRGEVRGGGKKPWRQKGTGRARFGSSRNPIWRGGGIAFGPTGNENYTKQLNTKSKRLAVKQALTLATDAGKIIVIESMDLNSAKTKDAQALLAKLGIKGRTLIVNENVTPEAKRSVNNLAEVKLVSAKYLNTYDILNADSIIIAKPALTPIGEWLGGTK